jgi:hypothetical protein
MYLNYYSPRFLEFNNPVKATVRTIPWRISSTLNFQSKLKQHFQCEGSNKKRTKLEYLRCCENKQRTLMLQVFCYMPGIRPWRLSLVCCLQWAPISRAIPQGTWQLSRKEFDAPTHRSNTILCASSCCSQCCCQYKSPTENTRVNQPQSSILTTENWER